MKKKIVALMLSVILSVVTVGGSVAVYASEIDNDVLAKDTVDTDENADISDEDDSDTEENISAEDSIDVTESDEDEAAEEISIDADIDEIASTDESGENVEGEETDGTGLAGDAEIVSSEYASEDGKEAKLYYTRWIADDASDPTKWKLKKLTSTEENQYYTADDGIVKITTLNSDGNELQTGLYAFDADGYLLTGRNKIGNEYYHFKSTDEVTVIVSTLTPEYKAPYNSAFGQAITDNAWKWESGDGIFAKYGSDGKAVSFNCNRVYKIGNDYYYILDNGKPYVGDKKMTWETQKGEATYLFEEAASKDAIPGKMARSKWTSRTTSKGIQWRFFSGDGRLKAHGIQIAKLSSNSNNYYLIDANGYIIKKKMVKAANNFYYYSNENGVVYKDKLVKVGNYRYYFTADGRRATWTNQWRKLSCQGNRYYYFGSTGGQIKEQKGIKKVTVGKTYIGWFYFPSSGNHLLSSWNGGRYYRSDGRMASGFTKVGSKYYYFKFSNSKKYQGTLYKNQWITDNKKQYYAQADGSLVVNSWKFGYYFKSDCSKAISERVYGDVYVDCFGYKCTKADLQLDGLKKKLRSMLNSYSGSWSVYVKDLKTGAVISMNDQAMYSASVIKAFVMASTFDQINKGKLSYNSTIKSLLKEMITVSDNEACNTLVRYNSSSRSFVAGTKTINNYLKANGYAKTSCHHTLHPSSSSYTSDGKGSNSASAKDCGVLLEKIYNGTCVSKAYSKEMRNLLLAQTRRWKIPAGVPSGIRVANKTGETSSVQHDMAIVYGKKKDYVICVFSNTGNEGYSISRIKNISSTVYSYLNK